MEIWKASVALEGLKKGNIVVSLLASLFLKTRRNLDVL
jgi:hypothetical protein